MKILDLENEITLLQEKYNLLVCCNADDENSKTQLIKERESILEKIITLQEELIKS